MDAPRLMTVAETSVFRRKASELLDQEEHDARIDFLADNPEAGDLIRGSGGDAALAPRARRLTRSRRPFRRRSPTRGARGPA
jgi:hypothetical protein